MVLNSVSCSWVVSPVSCFEHSSQHYQRVGMLRLGGCAFLFKHQLLPKSSVSPLACTCPQPSGINYALNFQTWTHQRGELLLMLVKDELVMDRMRLVYLLGKEVIATCLPTVPMLADKSRKGMPY